MNSLKINWNQGAQQFVWKAVFNRYNNRLMKGLMCLNPIAMPLPVRQRRTIARLRIEWIVIMGENYLYYYLQLP